ncbi:hypothetical protein [Streptomyces sp. NBC_01451]|uniref:hypothetical protein n=1 Tax=Streptomyces sp. NBC_01451 TaxID=2903872 RepID=UPI002E30C4A5|nr:hypothetical protein [Streptomyces sp. NBC_01451]
MITSIDIEQAETRVSEARQRGARARMAARTDVEDAIQREVRRADEVKAAKARQDEALKARKIAEKPHAAELKSLNASLEKSAETVVRAQQEAAQALLKLVGALRDHNASASEVHARLAALGLPLGDEDATYETGHGRAGILRINGTPWGPVPEDALTQYVVAEVMKRVFGAKHTGARAQDVRVHSLLRGAGGMLTERLKAVA